MTKAGSIHKQKPIGMLVLFIILSLAVIGFLISIFKMMSNPKNTPSHTAIVHDRALRGKIVSADGYTLSRSNKTYQATIFKNSIDPVKLDLFVKLFAIYSNIDEKKIKNIIKRSKNYTVLTNNLDASTAIRLKILAYKFLRMRVFRTIKNSHGVDILYGMDIIENSENRSFALHKTLSPVLGYVRSVDDDRYKRVIGVKGLEKSYEKYLSSSEDGFVQGIRDVSGTIIRNQTSIVKKRRDGMDIHLNIPLDLQRRVELILDDMKKLTDAKEIIAGVMQSHTGKVIALASSQRYDPGNIQKDDVYTLNPKFSEFLYEPGSTMKPITMAIAIEAGKVTPNKWFDTNNGRLKLSKRFTIKDDHPKESMTAEDIIIHSSNIGITKIAWLLDEKTLYDGYGKFGFGKASGIDLSRDLPGRMRSQQQLKNSIVKASQAYGYGMLASFAQLFKAYSAFNNNGISVTPRIVAYLQSPDGKRYRSKPLVDNLMSISKQTAKKIKKILKKVVLEGTGTAAAYPGLEIGGKTGTSHIVKQGRYVDNYNSSFFGFANDNKGNKYTIGVLAIGLYKKHMHYASQSAVPIFKKIVTSMIETGHLKPAFSIIQKQELEIKEQKRQEAALRKQRNRAKEIKAKLRKKREEIKKKQKADQRKTIHKKITSQKLSVPKKTIIFPVQKITPQADTPNLF